MSKGLNHTLEKSEAVISDLLSSNPLLASARERVKEQILRSLARQALQDLGSPVDIATSALAFVDLKGEWMESATLSLKNLLLEKIVENVLEQLGDPETSSLEALQRVDTNDPRLVSVQDRLKSRIVDRLVAQAAEEIDQELKPARPDKPHVAINQIIRSDCTPQQEIDLTAPVRTPELTQPAISAIRLSGQAGPSPVQLRPPEPATRNDPGIDRVNHTPPETNGTGLAGFYVYGILAADSNDPIERMPDVSVDPPHRPFLIRHGSIQAIVSRVTSAEFDRDALERNLKDLEWKRVHKARHIQVLGSFMDAGFTPLPLHFCTLHPTQKHVEQFLSEQHDQFIAGLARLQNKREWGIKIACDTELLLNVVRGSGDRIDSFIAQLPEMVASVIASEPSPVLIDEVDVISESCKKLCHHALLKVADEGVLNPVLQNDLESADWTIMNGSYLVNLNQESSFMTELGRLKSRHGHIGLTFEVSGPRPPVSFSL